MANPTLTLEDVARLRAVAASDLDFAIHSIEPQGQRDWSAANARTRLALCDAAELGLRLRALAQRNTCGGGTVGNSESLNVALNCGSQHGRRPWWHDGGDVMNCIIHGDQWCSCQPIKDWWSEEAREQMRVEVDAQFASAKIRIAREEEAARVAAHWANESAERAHVFATLRTIVDVLNIGVLFEAWGKEKAAEALMEVSETCLDAIWHSLRDQPDEKLTRHAQGIRDALRIVQLEIDAPERWYPIDEAADALSPSEEQ